MRAFSHTSQESLVLLSSTSSALRKVRTSTLLLKTGTLLNGLLFFCNYFFFVVDQKKLQEVMMEVAVYCSIYQDTLSTGMKSTPSAGAACCAQFSGKDGGESVST